MTISDQFFFTVFQHFKKNHKKIASKLAIAYISLLQISLLLLFGVFFSVFFSQMNVSTMSSDKAWALFFLLSVIIYFKNWMQYSGKRRNVMNAKMSNRKTKKHSIWLLMLLPIACVALSVVLSNAF
ncbi:MAG: hypothetical protein KJP09_11545 [Bacteroidia bacterium]|nr:hypothetical protein [Bacteroidia bacterium]MBT8308812.1 hypothetical protein [Bacteroidia bacterium]NND11733.1 hypothetical protein [Flavobacteriaceae bacterium]NNK28339.1 hypothetical protein [Flavobacteriaceae bacterium]NNL60706.1 hypothetical protein [Flavobacteriaceae bacterium]